MFHNLGGMRLPVSCRKPRCALRRATSSAVATAAAESAVHAKASGQLSPRHGFSGGSSPFNARHPVSSPRSTILPATIAAPAPTSSHVARRGFIVVRRGLTLFFTATATAFELDQSEWQAGCRRSPAFALFQGGDVPDVVSPVPRIEAEHLLQGEHAPLLGMLESAPKIRRVH